MIRKKFFDLIARQFSSEVLRKKIPKKFEEIPGPKGFFGIGNFYNYFKIIGKYNFDELHKANYDKYLKYGPIVCEHMFKGVPIVWLYDPNDIAQMFNDDLENYPYRVSHFALKKYRTEHPELYNGAGLVIENGQEWRRLRTQLQKGLNTNDIFNFLPHVDEVLQEFVENLSTRINENSEIDDMIDEMERLSLEIICYVFLGERLKSFSNAERQSSSISSNLVKAGKDTLTSIASTDLFPQAWRYFDTKDFKKMKRASQIVENFLLTTLSKLKAKDSIFEKYSNFYKLNEKDIFGFLADAILSHHSLAYTLSNVIYHVSKHKNVQKSIHEEALKILPQTNQFITKKTLDYEIPYTRAVFKEASRLNPLTIGIARILSKDKILSGYFVPKNTLVMSQNFIACRLEENFKDPLKFKPERWLKSSDEKIHPHLVIPFGNGLRSCIGRRFAEQIIHIVLLRLMRNFLIETTNDGNNEMEFKTLLVNIPTQKLPMRIIRND